MAGVPVCLSEPYGTKEFTTAYLRIKITIMKYLFWVCLSIVFLISVYNWAYKRGQEDGYNYTMTHLSKLNNDVTIGDILHQLTWKNTKYNSRLIK